MKKDLRSNVIIMDGAMGTMVKSLGLNESDFRGKEFLKHPYNLSGFIDILNLTKPDIIKNIHLAYLRAGAEVIKTNTFNSNLVSLNIFGLNEKKRLTKRLNRAGMEIARQAVNEMKSKGGDGEYLVAGSIGPSPFSLSKTSDGERKELRKRLYEAYRLQGECLIENGVDILFCETVYDFLNLQVVLKALQDSINAKEKLVPIMISFNMSQGSDRIFSGEPLDYLGSFLNDEENVEIVGLNCGYGLDNLRENVKTLRSVSRHLISVSPNAGFPDKEGKYKLNPEEFSETLYSLVEEGLVDFVGGCCGTTPDYIQALKLKSVTRY